MREAETSLWRSFSVFVFCIVDNVNCSAAFNTMQCNIGVQKSSELMNGSTAGFWVPKGDRKSVV